MYYMHKCVVTIDCTMSSQLNKTILLLYASHSDTFYTTDLT